MSEQAAALCCHACVFVFACGFNLKVLRFGWLSAPILEISFMLFCCIFSPPLENAIVGAHLVGAFIKEIKDGVFLLRLDSKEFPADSFIDFPRDEEFDLSPRVQLGCRSGFRRISSPGKAVPNSQGCGMFPSLMSLG